MMKRWNKPLLVLALAAVLSVGQFTLAQEAVEAEVLADVAAAFENTWGVTSLHMVSQSLTESAGGTEGFTLNTQQTQEFDLARTEIGWNAEGSLMTSITLPIGALELGAEVVRMDGVTYIRFNKVPEGIPLDLPQEWVDLEQFTAAQGSNSGAALNGNLPLGASGDQLLAPLMIPLDEQSVTQIEALPSDEIEGESMRVYQITVDPAAVLESDASTLLNAGAAVGFGGFPGGTGGGFPPQGAPELPAAGELTLPAPEDIQMTFAVYIGENDNLVYRLYTIIQIASSGEGENTRPGLQTTMITDYSRFNEAVEITAPEVDP